MLVLFNYISEPFFVDYCLTSWCRFTCNRTHKNAFPLFDEMMAWRKGNCKWYHFIFIFFSHLKKFYPMFILLYFLTKVAVNFIFFLIVLITFKFYWKNISLYNVWTKSKNKHFTYNRFEFLKFILLKIFFTCHYFFLLVINAKFIFSRKPIW